eukprot:354835-Chlamydomonas_euryale.AAC.2
MPTPAAHPGALQGSHEAGRCAGRDPQGKCGVWTGRSACGRGRPATCPAWQSLVAWLPGNSREDASVECAQEGASVECAQEGASVECAQEGRQERIERVGSGEGCRLVTRARIEWGRGRSG